MTTSVPRAKENLRKGVAFTLLAIFLFATQDATSKFLVQGFSPFQIAMMRFWAFCLMSLVLVMRKGQVLGAFRSRAPGVQVLRGLLLVVDIWFFMIAVRTVPLAELQAIMLVYPLIVTLAAIPLLGEKVGIFRFSAVFAGFLGALVIVRPGGLPFDQGAIAGLGSAVCYAIYLVLTRRVAGTDPYETSMLYVGVVGLILTTTVGVFFWQTPDWFSFLLIFYIMSTGCVAHGLIMLALAAAPASTLQPFNYTALPWGILFGYLVFGQLIDPVSLLGAGLIVAAGMVVIARERFKKAQALRTDASPGG